MYLITNTTNKEINISDININIKPFSMRDLDLVKSKSEIDNSKDLKISLKNGIIKLMKTDRDVKKEEIKIEEKTVATVANNMDVSLLLSGIKDLIKEELKNNKNNIDQNEIIAEIKKIQQSGEPLKENEINNIDESILLKIHEKTINKMKTLPSEGSLKIEGKKEINDIGNIDELEGLL